jgi:WD40 repeat protein
MYSHDGAKIVTASYDSCLKIWDAIKGKEIATLSGHSAAVQACDFSPLGTQIVSASSDQTLKLWDVENGVEIIALAGHSNTVDGCAFSPDGQRIISMSLDNMIKLWDSSNGDCLGTLPLLGKPSTLAHHPYQPYVACGDSGGSVYIAQYSGFVMDPIIVTPIALDERIVARCPSCQQHIPIDKNKLGIEMACSTVGCGEIEN